jgi:transcriptional regulator with XRE-family HTH domain
MATRPAPTLRAAIRAAPGATPAVDDPMAALGPRLRHARLVRGLTLRAVSDGAGCSEGMLSKIERGLALPSLAALHRLASVLQTNVTELTTSAPAQASPVQRLGERTVVEFPPGGRSRRAGIRLERVTVPAKGRLLQADVHVIESRVSSREQISHAGEELGYVLEGRLELTLCDQRYLLAAGDSFHFASDLPHSYRNPGRVCTRVLWVNSPPTF